MPRITVVATDLPVPLPDGRSVLPASQVPEGMDLEADLFVRRRLAEGELAEVTPPAAPARVKKEG
jgi:hypothetical protein